VNLSKSGITMRIYSEVYTDSQTIATAISLGARGALT
jgi:hypothetical protein